MTDTVPPPPSNPDLDPDLGSALASADPGSDPAAAPPAGGGGRSLSSFISPDDWRLYHLMRELDDGDRARVIAFAELLHNLERAAKWAANR